MKMRSLRLKLSLLFLLVALVGVLVVALWVGTTVETGFDAYCRSCGMVGGSGAEGEECEGARAVGVLEQTYVDAIHSSIWRAALIASLAALVLAYFFSRLITGPINILRDSARRIRDGDLSQQVRVKTDDELGELAVAFNDMAHQLDAKERGRRQLLADVVHELRTPLSIIQGNLEAWRDGVVTPTADAIGSVHDEAVVLSRLITDLRDLSLAEAGQINLALEDVDIVQLVASTVASSQDRARHAGIALTVSPDEQTKMTYADPGRIRQVIRNLLDNALRHTPHGGHINVSITTDRDGSVVVSVADTGTGIAAVDLPHVFEHFYKADQSRERSRSGSGIGLAIVKQLVEAHGGHVRAESAQGQGSTFTITLPTRPGGPLDL
jgi:two-component system sensor histidine kinase BaeS